MIKETPEERRKRQTREAAARYREKNLERRRADSREYNRAKRASDPQFKEKQRLASKLYYDCLNKDERDARYARTKDWRHKNPDRFAELSRKHAKASQARRKDTINEYRRSYIVKRRTNDIQFKLSQNLRTRFHSALRGKFRTSSAVRNLGCTIPELKVWLERWFKPGMTWENYGTEWHIDHVTPLADYDLTDLEQLQAACFFLNLQPMWALDNLKKGASLPEPEYG